MAKLGGSVQRFDEDRPPFCTTMPGVSAVRLPSPGELVLGRFRVVSARGNGAMGVLFEAYDEARGHAVALKVLRPEIADLPGVALRMSREALAMSLVDDPHLVRILDVGRTEVGLPFLSMEWLEGADLGKILGSAGKVPVPTAVRWIRQACEGLAQAHARGIVHRDVKPENLFLASGPGGEPVLKVIDFGVSKLDGAAANLTQTQASIGTPLYMSPEQIRALRDVDARADVWGLGVVLFELVAGYPPFCGDSAEAVIAAIIADPPRDLASVEGVPSGLDEVLLRALSKDRERRFPTVEAFAEALEPYESAQLEPAPTLVTELPPDFDLLVREAPPELLGPRTSEAQAEHAGPGSPADAIHPLTIPAASAAPTGLLASPPSPPSHRTPGPTMAPSAARAAPPPSKVQTVLAGVGLLIAGVIVATLIVLGRERRASRQVASSRDTRAGSPTVQSALADANVAPRNPTCILRSSTAELVGVRPVEARRVLEDLDATLEQSPNTTIRLAPRALGAPGELLAWNATPLISEAHEGHATVLVATDRGLYVSMLDSPGVERLDDENRQRLLGVLDERRAGVLVLAEGELEVSRLRETLELLRKLPRVGLLVPVREPPKVTSGSYACAEGGPPARPASADELALLKEGLRAGEETCGRDHPFDVWLPVRVRMLPGSDAGQGCWERSTQTSPEARLCAANVARRLSLAATRGDRELVAFELVPRGPDVRALCD
jgi:serine/threonine-protein kinase